MLRDRKLSQNPYFLAVFGVIMVGKCTFEVSLHLIIYRRKRLKFRRFIAFSLVFRPKTACVRHIWLFESYYTDNNYNHLMGVFTTPPDNSERDYPTLAMPELGTFTAFFPFSLSNCKMRSFSFPISSACSAIFSINAVGSLFCNVGLVLS